MKSPSVSMDNPSIITQVTNPKEEEILSCAQDKGERWRNARGAAGFPHPLAGDLGRLSCWWDGGLCWGTVGWARPTTCQGVGLRGTD